jgi:DNA-binding CsgD family transcriptional regulator
VGTRQRTPHLIGREGPLRQLFDALEDLDARAGSLVLVGGEAGIGKTRLLDEFAARAHEATVTRGGCIEDVAYAAWADALWWLLKSDLVVAEALSDRVRGQLARLVPQLGDPDPADGGEETGQHVLFEAVVDLLAEAATATKLVLVLDDVHWIDAASRELLRYVAGNLRRLPILLVVAYRPEDSGSERELLAQLARLSQRRIMLEGLPADATAEMGAILLGGDARPADVERIVRDADGNPLFVEELAAAVDDARVPETVRDLMLVRFNSLDEDARQLVRTASIIGPRAPRAWLVGAAGLDAARAPAATRAAVDAGVLLADGDGRGYEFRHALLRQAVLDDLLPDERVGLHHAIAAALTDHPERAVGVDRVSELARHWDAAEEARPALQWLVAAAHQAQVSYAFEAAAAMYERALIWWDALPDAPEVAGIDHVALLLAAADAAGFAGQIQRAADLGRAGLEEACALDPGRGVDAAGRVYPLLWTAGGGPELFEFAARTLVPVLDRVDPHARARFLVSNVENMIGHATPVETRAAALGALEAVREVDDPTLEARAHAVMAETYEHNGEFEHVDGEYTLAAQIARDADAHSMLALVIYKHAAFCTSVPRLADCTRYLDEVDELVERYGLRRYLFPARCLRALATCLQGDLPSASTVLASVDDVFAEGFDAWFRANVGALIKLCAGDYNGALAAIDPEAVGVAAPTDSELTIELAMLRADALAWKGDVEGARRAVDDGEAAARRYTETYFHGWLAMVATRVEADAAVAATAARRLDAIETAQERAGTIAETWQAAVAQLQAQHPLVHAYSCAVDAEMARLAGEDVAVHMDAAAAAFDAISMPYYATYFRWREAQAALDTGDWAVGTEMFRRSRAAAHAHGFGGLDQAITALARTHQLRLGPGRTTVDGDEPLSVRELEVLRLIVEGRSNPDIAEILHISRHTARAHVSNILRKLDASSRVEAVSEAHRRGFI